MNIQDKSKEELVNELKELREAYESLKASIKTDLPGCEPTDEALLKSRELLKSIEQAAKIGGWEFNVETMAQTWTEEIFHILEIDTSHGAPDVPEGIGFIAPEYQPMALLGIQRAIEFGEPYNQEWEVITAKGNKRWINAIATPYQKNGKTKSVSGSFQDITKRKLAEIALVRSEEKLSTTLHSIGDAVISTDKNGLVVNMNPVAEKLCGWQLAEVTGKPLAEVFTIINAETRQTVADPVTKALKKGETVGRANHTVLISKNGTEYQIADSAAPIKNKEGAITGVVLVFSDITGSYIAQKQIKESEERYRSLLNNLNAGIVVHAPDTSIVMNNARASELLGLTDAQMRGKAAIDPAWNFIHEDNTPLTLDEYPVNRIVAGKEPIKNQLLGINQPGKNDVVWVTVNGFPVLDTNGEITEVVISFIDITDRKQAEHKLQLAMEIAEVNTANLTAIIEGTANSIWAFNEQFEIVYINRVFKQEFYQTFGIWLEPGTSLINSLPEVIRPFWKKRYERVLNNEQFTVEDDVDTENGIVYIQVTFNPIVKKGQVIGGSCFGSNITLRKLEEIELLKAKEQAEANEEKYRLSESDMQEAQRLAHIGSWHWDLQTGLVAWSKELYNINGHHPNLPVPVFADMASFYTADSWKALNEAVTKTFNTGEPYNLDFEMVKPDGTIIFTNTRGCANYNEAGEMINLHGTVQDITERKLYEEKLNESLALLRIAGIKAKLGGWNVNLKENRSYWSDEVAAIHEMPKGYAPLVQDGINFYAPEWREKITKVFTDCAQQGIPYDEEMEIITAGGKRVWIKTIGEAVRDDKGTIFKVQGAFQDISGRKKIENEIRQLNETLENRISERTSQLETVNKELTFHLSELEQFSYVSNHDLQEPLRTLSQFTQLFNEKYAGKLDEEGNKYVDFIHKSAVRMKLLVKDLLEYSLLGKESVKTLVDCNKIIDAVLSDLDDSIRASNAKITTQELPVFSGYETEMRQLFQNLIGNAIKYQKQDNRPEIHISAESREKEWIFSIKDNGIGIDQKHFEKIFIIFQRLHNRNEYDGTGIGLANCRKVVGMHGGRIWVASTPGEGSVFMFTIPKQ
jgi:PAS domain S-box-containing protein